MVKLLITPPITPIGIPTEGELRQIGMNGEVIIHGGEGSAKKEQLRDGAPEHFHLACSRLLQSFSGKAHSVLVGGTTGEGIGFGLKQWQVLMTAMKKACPPDIRIMAGLLGHDEMIQDQVRIANALGINQFVLGLNHTGDSQRRFDKTISMFGPEDRAWLYNMPTFDPASLEFTSRCAQNLQVQGIKDSSKGTDPLRLRMLLQLKKERPDFQVFAGNEQVYGELDEEEFAHIDGLVSGNSNAHPDLLLQFTQNPKDSDTNGRRQDFHEEILSLSGLSERTGGAGIQKHILGLKLRLQGLEILEKPNAALYNPVGKLFHTYENS